MRCWARQGGLKLKGGSQGPGLLVNLEDKAYLAYLHVCSQRIRPEAADHVHFILANTAAERSELPTSSAMAVLR